MKNLLCLMLALVTFTWAGAQEDPEKDMKKVSRNLANYNLDPAANPDAINESVALIDKVVMNPAYANNGKAWLLYGNVYAEVVNGMTQTLVLDPNAPITSAEAVSKAFTGYEKAIANAEKAYDKKDAVNGLKAVLPNLYYVSNTILNRGEYGDAYIAYGAVVEAEKLVESNGEEGIFSDEELMNAEFVTAVCAASTGKNQEAVNMLNALKGKSFNEPGVYEYLFKSYDALGQKEESAAALEEGRMKYPNDKGLLFAEINYALAKGDLASLVDKLKVALAAEPDNVSIPTTLGNVYDQLYQKALADGDPVAAQQHFDNAKLYIGKALEINPNHFDAVYMMGALEYNKAAELANEVNKLAEDYSKEGTKKYNEKQAEMMTQFDKALPFFEKAEQLNPDDSNTLLALREIWARKGDFQKSEAYKAKYEVINGN